jgi:hypothetical protein
MAVVSLSNRNPYYTSREIDWQIMRDSYGGERYIKDKGQDYLPPTTVMVSDGMAFGQRGLAAYDAYKARAVYHELVKPSLQAMLGVMHRKEAEIEMPTKMDKLRACHLQRRVAVPASGPHQRTADAHGAARPAARRQDRRDHQRHAIHPCLQRRADD